MKKNILFIITFLFYVTASAQNNISISDDATYNADASAMLDVFSTTKGMLVPRMTTSQRESITNPATGLLVFDTDFSSFFFYENSNWQNLSNSSESLWSQNSSTGDIYFNTSDKNVGIGTNNPVSKLAVVANSGANPDDPLFEIKDESGNSIFSVTSEGVRVYVKDFEDSKGVSGGFAVGKYGAAKGMPDTTFLMVTPDSTRVYSQESTKGVSGGFAVGKYGSAKGTAENYMHITPENYLIGHRAGDSITTGINNIYFGYESGISNKEGQNNVFIGFNTGLEVGYGSNNVFIGNAAGKGLNVFGPETPHANVFIGNESGYNITYGFRNTFLGDHAGYSTTSGNSNVFIGRVAGYNSDNSYANIFIGDAAGYSNKSADNNIFIGQAAGYNSGLSETGGNNNVFIGKNAGTNNDTGQNNCYIGNDAGRDNNNTYNVMFGNGAGTFATNVMRSTFLGYHAGNHSNSNDNTYIGMGAGKNTESGKENVYIGSGTGYWGESGSYNVIIGKNAARLNTGESLGNKNIIIGYEAASNFAGISEKLIIENSDSNTPLIYGDFENDYLQINGTLNINNSYTFPNIDGNNGDILTTDGMGNITWTNLKNNEKLIKDELVKQNKSIIKLQKSNNDLVEKINELKKIIERNKNLINEQ